LAGVISTNKASSECGAGRILRAMTAMVRLLCPRQFADTGGKGIFMVTDILEYT
jgi:hypothetical protein